MKKILLLLITICLIACDDQSDYTTTYNSANKGTKKYINVCLDGVKYYEAARRDMLSPAIDSITGAHILCDGTPIIIEPPVVEINKPSTDNFFTRKEILEILGKLPLEHKQEIGRTLSKMIKKDSLYRIADELVE